MAPPMAETNALGLDPSTLVVPRWPDPDQCPPLEAFTTTRQSAASPRGELDRTHWLTQVHGRRVISVDEWRPGIEADGAWTDRPGAMVAVKTADCLPILLTGGSPPFVAAVHAGWRGLAAGIVASAVAACPGAPGHMQAWIGPAISAAHYEVDRAVYQAFVANGSPLETFFQRTRVGHWRADLVGIAMCQLRWAGVAQIATSGECTASAPERYYSHRAGLTPADQAGRMISLIWLA